MRAASSDSGQHRHEVDGSDQAEHEERLEGGVVDDLAGAGHLDEADDGGERRALDHLHQEADGRRQGDLEGLRQDDVAHARHVVQAERGRRPPTGRCGMAWIAAAPDLAEEGAGVQGQRQRRRPSRDRPRCRAPATPKKTRNSCISSGVPWNTWM